MAWPPLRRLPIVAPACLTEAEPEPCGDPHRRFPTFIAVVRRMMLPVLAFDKPRLPVGKDQSAMPRMLAGIGFDGIG